MRVATATLVNAPLPRLLQFVAYHLNAGIDEMHLFFDNPQDPGYDALHAHPRVHCYRCDDEFWRATQAPLAQLPPTAVTKKQRALLWWVMHRVRPDADYLASIDQDELIWAKQGIRAALRRELVPGVRHLQLKPWEGVPPRLHMADPFAEITLFKEQRKELVPRAKRLGTKAPFRGRRLLRGHLRGKPIVTLDGSVPDIWVHGPSFRDARRWNVTMVKSTHLCVLHFDAGSFEQWRAKWDQRIDDPQVHDRPSRARRRQAVRYERARAEDRLRRLYRREYMLSRRDATVLRGVGLVHKVVLDPRLFVLPPD